MTSLNTYIDHTKLGPTVSLEQIDQLIQEGLQYQFKSLCVNTHFVSYVSNKLKDSNVLTCTVIGFPHGSHTKEVKAFETKEAIQAGADEIDMVINNTFVKAKDYQETYNDIKAVVNAAKR